MSKRKSISESNGFRFYVLVLTANRTGVTGLNDAQHALHRFLILVLTSKMDVIRHPAGNGAICPRVSTVFCIYWGCVYHSEKYILHTSISTHLGEQLLRRSCKNLFMSDALPMLDKPSASMMGYTYMSSSSYLVLSSSKSASSMKLSSLSSTKDTAADGLVVRADFLAWPEVAVTDCSERVPVVSPLKKL